MKARAATDIGQERNVNQDYIYSSLDPVGCLPNLFVIADGMGGHKAGDMASKFTVENFVNLLQQASGKDPISNISDAITTVNSMLLEKAGESEEYNGMGTTLVVASIFNHVLKVANVGDSRLYVVGTEIMQITRDHSLVEEMVSLGEIDRSEARTHAQKNIITRAIGGYDRVEAEVFSVDLKPGDQILMCSDGLSNMLEDSTILKIVKSSANPDEAVERLIQTANQNGGKDNISVIMIEP